MRGRVLCFIAVLLAGTAAAAPDPGDVQRMLRLLAGIAGEYREAFDGGGALVRPVEVEEARLLLAEVRDLSDRLTAAGVAGVAEQVQALGTLVDARLPAAAVATQADVVRRNLVRATGVREEVLPGERPSLARGGEIFRANCAGCHGERGAGDGPDAARLGLAPARFTDPAFLRRETPEDAFNVVSVGRRKSGMPGWGDALGVQEIWDTVSFVWSLGRTPESVAAGQHLWMDRCASCHGPQGDPADASAGAPDRATRSLAGLREGARVSDAELFAAVGAGYPPMPAFASLLDERARWDVVAFVRTLSLEGAAGAPLEPDRGAAFAEVKRLVDGVLAARRRGDPAVHQLATNAYMRFEPLEQPLADVDPARMDALESTFSRFRSALRDPVAGDPEAIAQDLRAGLDDAAGVLRPHAAPAASPAPATLLVVVVAALGLVAAGALFRARPQTSGRAMTK